MIDLDEHITDPQFDVVDEDYICIACHHEFTVTIQYEFGTGTPMTEDGTIKCPECGREIE